MPNLIEIIKIIYVCSNGNLKHVARAGNFIRQNNATFKSNQPNVGSFSVAGNTTLYKNSNIT